METSFCAGIVGNSGSPPATVGAATAASRPRRDPVWATWLRSLGRARRHPAWAPPPLDPSIARGPCSDMGKPGAIGKASNRLQPPSPTRCRRVGICRLSAGGTGRGRHLSPVTGPSSDARQPDFALAERRKMPTSGPILELSKVVNSGIYRWHGDCPVTARYDGWKARAVGVWRSLTGGALGQVRVSSCLVALEPALALLVGGAGDWSPSALLAC
jgi:hypothetical protein